MMNPSCMVCRDVKHFEVVLQGVRNTNNNLKAMINKVKIQKTIGDMKIPTREMEIINSLDISKRQDLLRLKRYSPNARLMCGNACIKVRKHDLDRAFTDFYTNYLKLIYILNNIDNEMEFNRFKNVCLYYLRGDLGHFYNNLSRFRFVDKSIKGEK